MLHIYKSLVSIVIFITLFFTLTACSTTSPTGQNDAALQALLNQSKMTESKRKLLTLSSTIEAEKYLTSGREKSALKIANMALSFDPKNADAKYVAGKAEIANGNYQAGHIHFSDLIKSDPKGEYFQFLGISQYFLGDKIAASDSFQTAIKLDPTLWRALALQGRIENSQGNYTKADLYLTDALNQSLSPASVYEHIGQTNIERKKWAKALSAFETAQSLSKQSIGQHDHYRLALAKSGKMSSVLKTASSDEIGRLYRNLGEEALNNGNKLDAVTNLKKAKVYFSRHDIQTDKLLNTAINLKG